VAKAAAAPQSSCSPPKKLQPPQNKHADRNLAVHKILMNIPLSTQELRNRRLKKLGFIIFLLLVLYSSSYKKTLKHSLKPKEAIELLHAQNGINFTVVATFSLSVHKLVRLVVMVTCGSVKF